MAKPEEKITGMLLEMKDMGLFPNKPARPTAGEVLYGKMVERKLEPYMLAREIGHHAEEIGLTSIFFRIATWESMINQTLFYNKPIGLGLAKGLAAVFPDTTAEFWMGLNPKEEGHEPNV